MVRAPSEFSMTRGLRPSCNSIRVNMKEESEISRLGAARPCEKDHPCTIGLLKIDNELTIMATQELVVPKSIPITSPASAADDCHRMVRSAFVAEDRKVEAVVRPLRSPICRDMMIERRCRYCDINAVDYSTR